MKVRSSGCQPYPALRLQSLGSAHVCVCACAMAPQAGMRNENPSTSIEVPSTTNEDTMRPTTTTTHGVPLHRRPWEATGHGVPSPRHSSPQYPCPFSYSSTRRGEKFATPFPRPEAPTIQYQCLEQPSHEIEHPATTTVHSDLSDLVNEAQMSIACRSPKRQGCTDVHSTCQTYSTPSPHRHHTMIAEMMIVAAMAARKHTPPNSPS